MTKKHQYDPNLARRGNQPIMKGMALTTAMMPGFIATYMMQLDSMKETDPEGRETGMGETI